MKRHRSTIAGSDETRLHTFVMDYCFPIQCIQQRFTALVIKDVRTKMISMFLILQKGVSDYPVADFMSGRGCCRTTLKSDGEPAIVVLQKAEKNSRQSDTFLEHSPKGDCLSKRSSRERSEGSKKNDTHMEDVCRQRS